jgi:hypothetical protein
MDRFGFHGSVLLGYAGTEIQCNAAAFELVRGLVYRPFFIEQNFRIPDDGLGSGGIANRRVTRRTFFHHRQPFSCLKPRWTGGAVDAVDAGGTSGNGWA